MNINLDKYITEPETNLIDVMHQIDVNTKGIIYVCSNNKLNGVITDGDIRRYIVKNESILGKAKDLMNIDPLFVYINDNIDVKQYMKNKSIQSIPILSSNKEIIDIKFIDKLTRTNISLNTPVVIMAGGKGKRLYPYTQILPKPLIPINEKTITEIIMDRFDEYGCKKFTMIVNYKKEFIKAFFKENENRRDICFIDEDKYMGTGGGLKLLEGLINETFFMTNCDILVDEDYSEILKYHKLTNNIITMVCALKNEEFPYGTIETDENGKAIKLAEKPTFEFLTNTGLYLIEPAFLNYIPANEFIHITDVIQSCIDNGENVGVFPIRDEAWMDMGQIGGLEKMRGHLNGN